MEQPSLHNAAKILYVFQLGSKTFHSSTSNVRDEESLEFGRPPMSKPLTCSFSGHLGYSFIFVAFRTIQTEYNSAELSSTCTCRYLEIAEAGKWSGVWVKNFNAAGSMMILLHFRGAGNNLQVPVTHL